MLLMTIICAGLWVIAAIGFEILWAPICSQSVYHSKGFYCRIWWTGLAIIVFAQGSSFALLVNLTAIAVVSLSHINLSDRNVGVVRMSDVIRNIPHSVRMFVQRLRVHVK